MRRGPRGARRRGRRTAACGGASEALALWRGPPLADLSFEALAAARDRAPRGAAPGGARGPDRGRPRARPARRDRRRARGADRRSTRCASGRAGSSCSPSTARAARRRRSTSTATRAAPWSTSSGSSPAARCRTSSRRSSRQDADARARAARRQRRSPRATLVGRERELAELVPRSRAGARRTRRPGPDRRRAGDRQEPARRGARRRARASAARRVLVGRCWEAGGAPAYWPWIQALRPCVAREPSRTTLRAWVGAAAPSWPRSCRSWATCCPTCRRRAPDVERGALSPVRVVRVVPHEAPPRRSRSRSSSTTCTRPTRSSVLLLRFVADAARAARRSSSSAATATRRSGPELADALAGARAASRSLQRVVADGTEPGRTRRACSSWSSGDAPPDELAAKVHDETDGNPLFAGEVGRLLAVGGRRGRGAEKLPVPEGVREAIGRRLERMSRRLPAGARPGVRPRPRVRRRRARARQRARARTSSSPRSRRRWRRGSWASVPERGGRLRFSHMLIRDAVYEELPATRRLRLHREIGEALEAPLRRKPRAAPRRARPSLPARGSRRGRARRSRYADAAGRPRRVASSPTRRRRATTGARSTLLETRRAGDRGRDLRPAALARRRPAAARATTRGEGGLPPTPPRSPSSDGWAEPARAGGARLRRAVRVGAREHRSRRSSRCSSARSPRSASEDSPARVRLLGRLAAATARRRGPRAPGRARESEAVAIAERIGDPATLA